MEPSWFQLLSCNQDNQEAAVKVCLHIFTRSSNRSVAWWTWKTTATTIRAHPGCSKATVEVEDENVTRCMAYISQVIRAPNCWPISSRSGLYSYSRQRPGGCLRSNRLQYPSPANGYPRLTLSRWSKVTIFIFFLSLYTFSFFLRVYKPGKVPISVSAS